MNENIQIKVNSTNIKIDNCLKIKIKGNIKRLRRTNYHLEIYKKIFLYFINNITILYKILRKCIYNFIYKKD